MTSVEQIELALQYTSYVIQKRRKGQKHCDMCFKELTKTETSNFCDMHRKQLEETTGKEHIVKKQENLEEVFAKLSNSLEYKGTGFLPWKTVSKALKKTGFRVMFNYHNASSHCIEIGEIAGWNKMNHFTELLLPIIQLHDSKAEFMYYRGTVLWLARFRMRTVSQMLQQGIPAYSK